ncbi:MAG: hypothetical protein K8J08_03420 [Thermoanaerobaculia bacterium]|nr:hypothetical protein [Thermoanaerobaculia bacterium]
MNQRGSHESEESETKARRGASGSDSILDDSTAVDPALPESMPSPSPDSMPDYGGGPSDAYFGLEPQDVDQIRWMLTLEPLERLRYVERFAAGVQALRASGV